MSDSDKIFATFVMALVLAILSITTYEISIKYFEYDIKRMEIHCSGDRNETHNK